MIRKIWKLILASFYAMESEKLKLRNDQGKIRTGSVLLVVALVVGLGILFFSLLKGMFFLSKSLHILGVAIGAPYYMIGLILGMSWITSLCFGFIWVIQIFYRSKDLSLLITMPISTKTLITSRFAIVWLYEMGVHLLIISPALVAFYVVEGVTVLSLLGGVFLIVFGLIPIICLSAVLAFLLGKIPRLTQSKTAFELIGILLTVTIALGVQFGMQSVLELGSSGELTQELQQSILITNMAHLFSTWKNPLVWFASGMDSITALLLVSIGSILFGWFVVSVMSQKMIPVIQMSLESSGGRSRISQKKEPMDVSKTYEQNSVLMALVRKNIRVTFSESVFYMQELSVFFIVPIIFVSSIVFSGDIESYSEFFTMFGDYLALSFFVVISFIMGFLVFSGSIAITKEGKSFDRSRMLPVDPYVQMKAYIIPFLAVYTLYGWLSLGVVGGLLGALQDMFLFFIALAIQNIFLGGLGLCFNLIFPTTSWVTPQQGVKRSKNAMFGSFFSIGWFISIIAIAIGAGALEIPQQYIALGFIVLFLVLSILLWRIVKKKSRSLFTSYES